MRGQRRELEERGAAVQQALDAVAGKELAARDVALRCAFAAVRAGCLQLRVRVVDRRARN